MSNKAAGLRTVSIREGSQMRCNLGGTILLLRDSLEVTWMMDELRLNSVQKNKGIIKPPYVRKATVKMCQQRGNPVDRGVARGPASVTDVMEL